MIRTSSVFIMAVLIFMSCKVVDDNSDSNTTSVDSFKIANGEIQGWSYESDWEWKDFNSTTMNGKVDGDAEYFEKNGLISGAAQKLQNISSEKMEIWIMDFSSEQTAAKMFQIYVNSSKFTTQKEVTGFPATTALIDDSSIEGCKTIIQLGQFIIVAFFTNYENDSKATIDATGLLKVFQSKQK